jgi:phosphoglycolate phosphatase-like HAD superfamily hydrolase
MTPRPTVLLFDVDGTLLSAGGAGRRALERAFAQHCGTAAPLRDVAFNGMTDPGIVRAGLETLGRTAEAWRVAAILDAYLDVLGEELSAATNLLVHPGVEALLDVLTTERHVAVGLGTGNLREGARLKLARVGLDGYFAFGGFGSDHEDRAELLRIGATRGAARLGHAPDACRVVVIGDTPRDVAAARAIGAASLGVATGGCAPDDLRDAGATWSVADLTVPEARHLLCKGETT